MNTENNAMPASSIETNPSMPASTTYAEAYSVLNSVAEKLRQAGPDDIDGLIADYRRAMAAYRICADRLDLIRRELDVELEATGSDPAATRGSR